MIKKKMIGYIEGKLLPQSDNESKTSSIDEYINWQNGIGVNIDFPIKRIKEMNNNYLIEGRLLRGQPLTKIYFSLNGWNNKRFPMICVDIDFKKMICDDTTKETRKEELINILLYGDSNDGLLSVVKSGDSFNNGLHIIYKTTESVKIFLPNLIRLIQSETEMDLGFTDVGVIDQSAYNTNHWIASRFNNGFIYLNKDCLDYKMIDFGKQPQKLNIPDTYLSGFHNRLVSYMIKSQLDIDSTMKLYERDLLKRPFSDKSLTFEDTLQRLHKWASKNKNTISSLSQSYNIFFTDKEGKSQCNKDILFSYINDEYEISNNGDPHTYFYKKKKTNKWRIFRYNKLDKTYSFKFIIFDDFNIDNIDKRNLIGNTLTMLIKNNEWGDFNIKRDLDTPTSVYLVINDSLIEITKDKVGYSEKNFLLESSVKLPIQNIDISFNYKNWHLYKSGYFDNITEDKYSLPKIIGSTVHMVRSGVNGGRMLFLTDAWNIKMDISGTGKSILSSFISKFRKSLFLDYSIDPNFLLSQVDEGTQMLIFDELPKDIDINYFRKFFGHNGININKKFLQPFTIDAVKLIMVSNYLIPENKADLDRRIEVGFTRFYERTSNPLRKVLGYDAFDDNQLKEKGSSFISSNQEHIIVEDWWNGCISYMIYCIQSYLKESFINLKSIKSMAKVYETNHTNMITGKNGILLTEIIENLEVHIKSMDSDEMKLRNKDILMMSRYANKSLSQNEYFIDNYLKLYHTDISYSKVVDRLGVLHILRKKQ